MKNIIIKSKILKNNFKINSIMLQYGIIEAVHRPQNSLNSMNLNSGNSARISLVPMSSNDNNNRDVIDEYHKNNNLKHLFQTFKMIDENDNNEDGITINNNIDFLKNFVSVKNKLSILKDKYKNITDEIILIKEYIKKLEILRTKIQETDISYDECFTFVSKELNPKVKDENMNKNDKEISTKKINNINDSILYSHNLISENDLKLLDIHKSIKELQNMIRLKDLIDIVKDLDTSSDDKNKILCNICCEKRIEYCVNPCGHCFCVDCNNQLLMNCHTCRGTVASKIKIYYE